MVKSQAQKPEEECQFQFEFVHQAKDNHSTKKPKLTGDAVITEAVGSLSLEWCPHLAMMSIDSLLGASTFCANAKEEEA